jgi:hypothetical protein
LGFLLPDFIPPLEAGISRHVAVDERVGLWQLILHAAVSRLSRKIDGALRSRGVQFSLDKAVAPAGQLRANSLLSLLFLQFEFFLFSV